MLSPCKGWSLSLFLPSERWTKGGILPRSDLSSGCCLETFEMWAMLTCSLLGLAPKQAFGFILKSFRHAHSSAFPSAELPRPLGRDLQWEFLCTGAGGWSSSPGSAINCVVSSLALTFFFFSKLYDHRSFASSVALICIKHDWGSSLQLSSVLVLLNF